MLQLARERGVLNGATVAVDSTTLEANAAMQGIVRRDTDDDGKAYLTGLMRESGQIGAEETPNLEELIRFDKSRNDKKVSNADWQSATDPDSRTARRKDGRTHLGYKAEHAVDLQGEMIVAAEIYHADLDDTCTLDDTVQTAQVNLQESGRDVQIENVVADDKNHRACQPPPDPRRGQTVNFQWAAKIPAVETVSRTRTRNRENCPQGLARTACSMPARRPRT